MLLRFALVIGAVSQALLASDFSPGLFANQNTGSLRDLTRQALDRQIRSALLGKQPATEKPLPPLRLDLPRNVQAEVRPSSACAVPLAQTKVDDTKQFTIKSWEAPKSASDAIATPPPVPGCKP